MRRARDIPVSIIRLRIGVAEQYGADRTRILAYAGLQPEILSYPGNRITVEQAVAIWQAIINETGKHDIGLECGMKVSLTSVGILGYVMMNSASAEQAIDKLRNHQRLVMSIAFWEKDTVGAHTTYRLVLQEDWQDMFRYTIDFMIAGLHHTLKQSTVAGITPVDIGFSIPKPDNADRYAEVFQHQQIKFNCTEPYLAYDTKDLNQPMVGSNHELFSHFDGLLAEETAVHDQINTSAGKVRQLISNQLRAQVPKIEDVAKTLAMSVRSLQVSLRDEQTSFQNILNEVRRDVSMKQLKKANLNITEVAFLTGYSDVSVFSRNFKKWTGLTPSQYQAQV